jgi:hypothetical protein
MSKYQFVYILSIVFLFLLSGCRTEAVLNLSNYPIPAIGGTSMKPEVIENGIVQAGNRLGWRMSRKGENTVLAYHVNDDGRQAIVAISFSTKAYSVNYYNSHFFLYDGEVIHKKYNRLVISLINGINDELYVIANKVLFEKGEIYIKNTSKE